MKKKIALFLAALTVMGSLAACGDRTTETEAQPETTIETEATEQMTEETTPPTEPVKRELADVILDDEAITIKMGDIIMPQDEAIKVQFEITNKRDIDIFVVDTKAYIDGILTSSTLYQEVDAGCTATATAYIDTDFLNLFQVKSINSVCYTLDAVEKDSYTKLASYNTGAIVLDETASDIDISGEECYHANDIKVSYICAKGTEVDNAYLVWFLVEGDEGADNVRLTSDRVSINGLRCSCVWVDTAISASERAVVKLYITPDDMESVNCESVDQIHEFNVKFNVLDKNWSNVDTFNFVTDSISFEK